MDPTLPDMEASPLELRGRETRSCACCGRAYTVSGGVIRYGEGREVEFELAFLTHAGGGPPSLACPRHRPLAG